MSWPGRSTETLAAQDEVVADVLPKFDQRADEIENQGFWSRAFDFLVDVVIGVLEHLAYLVIGIVVILVVAVVAVVVLVLVAAATFYVGGMAALGAFAALVLGAAALVVQYATVIAIGLIAFTIGLVIWELWTVFTDPTSTDKDKARAIGHAIFDLSTSFFGGKMVGWLGKGTSRLARLLGLASDDAARLARLLRILVAMRRDSVGSVVRSEVMRSLSSGY